jgi:hypothetical protein
MGGSRDIPFVAVALRADPGAAPDAVAASLTAAEADAALVAGPVDSTWLAAAATAAGLTVSGPAASDDLTMAFLGGEPLGDTTVVLPWDGGQITVHDALYEVREERYLDLMIFRLDDGTAARPAVGALLEYMATDVMNSAAVLLAVATPTPAVADSVGRMLSPAYFDALRCGADLQPADGAGVRLFYGPEARVYCRDAGTESPGIGPLVRATLTLGRR